VPKGAEVCSWFLVFFSLSVFLYFGGWFGLLLLLPWLGVILSLSLALERRPECMDLFVYIVVLFLPMLLLMLLLLLMPLPPISTRGDAAAD